MKRVASPSRSRSTEAKPAASVSPAAPTASRKANRKTVPHPSTSSEVLGSPATASTDKGTPSRAATPATPAISVVPAKWRWHYRVLLSLLARLRGECDELRRAGAETLEPHSLDPADSATDEFDHDLAMSRLSTDQDALYEINDALKRIADGTYGKCEETGRNIPAARLKAVPWARFTREVEERLEQSGDIAAPHVEQAKSVRRRGQIWLAPEEETEEEAEQHPARPANDESLSPVK